ncbi:MAG: general secretion pathway protein GspK [Candidatus Aureabacteria bacterium]|nr:general secretion pathway protein GspK [Candidatus Auribacterota bacterium]
MNRIGKNKDGSVLILTVWVLCYLSILAVGAGNMAFSRLLFAKYAKNRLVSYYLAKAGIEKAIIMIEADEDKGVVSFNIPILSNEDAFMEYPCDTGFFSVCYAVSLEDEGSEGGKRFLYGAEDESSRININKAPSGVLQKLLVNTADARPEEAYEIANSIIDWRDKDSNLSDMGAEEQYYSELDIPYHCKNSDFEVPEELMLVKGMNADIFSRISDIITVYGNGKVNINTAGKKTMLALGFSPEFADDVEEYRKGGDGVAGTDDDMVFMSPSEIRKAGLLSRADSDAVNFLSSDNILGVDSDVFRINSTGFILKGDERYSRRIICFVQRKKGDIPLILRWIED